MQRRHHRNINTVLATDYEDALGLDPAETRRIHDMIFAEYEADPEGKRSISHEVVMVEMDALIAQLERERAVRGWA